MTADKFHAAFPKDEKALPARGGPFLAADRWIINLQPVMEKENDASWSLSVTVVAAGSVISLTCLKMASTEPDHQRTSQTTTLDGTELAMD